MRTESRRRIIACTAAACFVGLLVGWIVAGWVAAPQPPIASAPAPEPSRFSPMEVALEEPGDRAASAQPAARVSSEMERFLEQAAAEDMVAVPSNALRRIQPMRGGRLSDAMAEALALSEEEVRRVNRIFEEAEEKLNRSELERLEIVSVSDEKVIFHIPRDIEAGRQLEEEFRQQFTEVLGDVDGAFFLSVHDYSCASDDYFDEFGKVDRTITFAMQPDSGDGIRLRFSNESPWAQKRGAHDQSEGMTYWPAFDLPLPATESDISGRPPSTYRSKFLIPLLPEPMRSHFEALERTVEEFRSSQEN